MCEILVYSLDQINSDSIIDRRSSFKSGMVVRVEKDGHEWGRMESKVNFISSGHPESNWNNEFVIIKVPKTPVEDFLHLLSIQNTYDNGKPFFITGPFGDPVRGTYRRKMWKLSLKKLLKKEKIILDNVGEVGIRRSRLERIVVRSFK